MKKIVLTALVGVLAASGSQSCSGGGSSSASGSGDGDKPATGKLCDVRLKAPWSEPMPGYSVIRARAEATCDEPPDTHKLQIWVEKFEKGKWIKPPQDQHVCEEVPQPGAWTPCDLLIYKCKDGRYRTRVLITGSGRYGDFAFSTPENEAVTRRLKCAEPGL